MIGNNDYKNVPKLQKAVNDARTMGETLKQLGFYRHGGGEPDPASVQRNASGIRQGGRSPATPHSSSTPATASRSPDRISCCRPTCRPPAEGQEELVRDASVLADRVIERLQNKKVRTAILVFDACRNNPFERSGTRAVAGGGGLAPMTQLPEGVFSVFSAGPRQTALDRLSNDDANPELGIHAHLCQGAAAAGREHGAGRSAHKPRIVSEMAETVSHKQIPVYFDQMVDDVFLNGAAKGLPETAVTKPAAPLPQVAALAAGDDRRVTAPPERQPSTRRSRCSRATMAAGPWCSRSSIRRSEFPGGWGMPANSARPVSSTRSIHAPASGCPISSIELARRRAGGDDPGCAMWICQARLQGPFPIKFDPEAALDPHDQRKILDMTATSWLSFREFNGLLVYYTQLMSYRCAIREARVGIDTAVPDKVLKMPPCDPRDPSVIPGDAVPYLKLPPSTQFVSVELTYRDGSISEIKSFRR